MLRLGVHQVIRHRAVLVVLHASIPDRCAPLIQPGNTCWTLPTASPVHLLMLLLPMHPVSVKHEEGQHAGDGMLPRTCPKEEHMGRNSWSFFSTSCNTSSV